MFLQKSNYFFTGNAELSIVDFDSQINSPIKTFNSVGLQRPKDVQNREFEILRSIKHPNIVRMFCVEEEEKTQEPCIIMELCIGHAV